MIVCLASIQQLISVSFYFIYICIVLHPFFMANVKKKNGMFITLYVYQGMITKTYCDEQLSTSSILVGRENRKINACLLEQPIFGNKVINWIIIPQNWFKVLNSQDCYELSSLNIFSVISTLFVQSTIPNLHK